MQVQTDLKTLAQKSIRSLQKLRYAVKQQVITTKLIIWSNIHFFFKRADTVKQGYVVFYTI